MRAHSNDRPHVKSAYFIKLIHPQTVFFSNVSIAGRICAADFKRITPNVFLMALHQPDTCHFMETITFKKNQMQGAILFPAGQQQTNRQLKRIAEMVEAFDTDDHLLRIEKIVQCERFIQLSPLQRFFRLSQHELEQIVWQLSMAGKLQVLEICSLTVVAEDFFQNCREECKKYILRCYEKRDREVSMTELAKWLAPLNQVEYAVRYLVRSLVSELPEIKIAQHNLVFQKVQLPDEDIGRIEAVEKAIRDNKQFAFTIEQAIAASGLSEKYVNDALWHLLDDGRITRLNNSDFIFTDDLVKIINRLKKFKRNQGDIIDIQTMRELTALNRKYIIVLFEYFDAQKITEFYKNKRKILITV